MSHKTCYNEWEKYCYLKINTSIGLDNNTKCVIINQIIVDENIIDTRLFCKIIHILLQQINNEFNNRIIVGNKNICFKNNVLKYANEIGEYICDLFYGFTNHDCLEYTYKYNM